MKPYWKLFLKVGGPFLNFFLGKENKIIIDAPFHTPCWFHPCLSPKNVGSSESELAIGKHKEREVGHEINSLELSDVTTGRMTYFDQYSMWSCLFIYSAYKYLLSVYHGLALL